MSFNGDDEQTWNEERRHRCEARYVAGLPDHTARARYLTLVAQERGTAVAERLRQAAWSRLTEGCA